MFGGSVVAQLVLRNLSSWTSMSWGLISLVIGLAGILFAVPTHSMVFLIISTVITGLGHGLSFMGSMALVNEISPVNSRGSVISSLFVVCYIGVGLPIIGIGFVTESIGLFNAILIFACLFTVMNIIIVLLITKKMTRKIKKPCTN
jgi:MFS family permease